MVQGPVAAGWVRVTGGEVTVSISTVGKVVVIVVA